MHKNKGGIVPKHSQNNSIHGGGGVITNYTQNHPTNMADSMGKTHT